MRPVDQETLASEKIVCYSQFPRAEGMPCPTGPHGKNQGQLGGRSAGRGHSVCVCVGGGGALSFFISWSLFRLMPIESQMVLVIKNLPAM